MRILLRTQVTRADGKQQDPSLRYNIHVNPSLIHELAGSACVVIVIFVAPACE